MCNLLPALDYSRAPRLNTREIGGEGFPYKLQPSPGHIVLIELVSIPLDITLQLSPGALHPTAICGVLAIPGPEFLPVMHLLERQRYSLNRKGQISKGIFGNFGNLFREDLLSTVSRSLSS